MQPVSGYNYVRIAGGVGTTVVTDRPATLKGVFWGGSYVGTLVVHDAATAAGTTATSDILSLGIPLLKYPESLELEIQCRNGIVYQATGTPVVTLVWK